MRTQPLTLQWHMQPVFGVDIALWSCLEINIAMICASVPALKPLFAKVMPRLLGSSVPGGGGGSSKNSSGKSSRYGLGYGGRSRSRAGTGSVPLQSFGIGGTNQDRDLEIGAVGAAAAGGDSGSDDDSDGAVRRVRGGGGGGAAGDAAAAKNGKMMGIRVHQTFEMRTVESSEVMMMTDDGSEKDLVTKPWSTAATNAHVSGGGGGVAAGSARNYSYGGGNKRGGGQ